MATQKKMVNLLVVHHDELVTYISSRFGNRGFAIEVVQETCLRLLSKPLDEFSQVSSPLGLLKRISLHLAIDIYRRDKLAHKHFDYSLEDVSSLHAFEHEDYSLPELSLAKHQYEQVLIHTILALPPMCQDVFILTQLYHLTQVEAAQQLGISRGMVAKHLTRALSSLIPVLFEQSCA